MALGVPQPVGSCPGDASAAPRLHMLMTAVLESANGMDTAGPVIQVALVVQAGLYTPQDRVALW